MYGIRILLILVTISGYEKVPEKTYLMPDMKICIERLRQYKPSATEIRLCEYRVDY